MYYRFVFILFIPISSGFTFTSLWSSLVEGVNYIADDILNSYERNVPEDARLNISQLIRKYNYTFEEHTVYTEDGYILNIHRIPNGRKTERNNQAVLLMHGILDSSDSWVLLGPDRALAYVLADAGYDVWMGNARGNKHASRHIDLNPTQTGFWEFTWEEIGLYDLPATIDYIENITDNNGLYYIGYSQGTTSFYVMTSMRTEYNSKVKLMFSLAPEAWMGNIRSPLIQFFSPANSILGYILSKFNVLTSGTTFFNRISSIVCTIIPIRCDNLMYALFGFNTKIDKTTLPVMFGHVPTGSSTLQFVHYGQLVQSGGFHRFDFGTEGNIVNYGTTVPPIYNCSNILVPVMLFYSDKDWLSDPKDVRILESKLPNVYGTEYMCDFNHLDYVYSMESIVIYNKIISIINDYENSMEH